MNRASPCFQAANPARNVRPSSLLSLERGSEVAVGPQWHRSRCSVSRASREIERSSLGQGWAKMLRKMERSRILWRDGAIGIEARASPDGETKGERNTCPSRTKG